MKFSIKTFFSKFDQIRSFLRIWLHLLKKYWMENFIFCVVEPCQISLWWSFFVKVVIEFPIASSSQEDGE